MNRLAEIHKRMNKSPKDEIHKLLIYLGEVFFGFVSPTRRYYSSSLDAHNDLVSHWY